MFNGMLKARFNLLNASLISLPFLFGNCKLGEHLSNSNSFEGHRIVHISYYNNRRPSHKLVAILSSVRDLSTKGLAFNYYYSIESRVLTKYTWGENKEVFTSITDRKSYPDAEVYGLNKLDSMIIDKTIFYLDSLKMGTIESVKNIEGFIIKSQINNPRAEPAK